MFLYYSIIFQIDHDVFVKTIEHLNSLYDEAEKVSPGTYCESCFACLTGYLVYLCMETHYQKVCTCVNNNFSSFLCAVCFCIKKITI